MKKITAQEFARNQAQALDALKPHETLAVTRHGKTLFVVTKPARRRLIRAAQLLKQLHAMPMTDADGDQILKQFVDETVS